MPVADTANTYLYFKDVPSTNSEWILPIRASSLWVARGDGLQLRSSSDRMLEAALPWNALDRLGRNGVLSTLHHGTPTVSREMSQLGLLVLF